MHCSAYCTATSVDTTRLFEHLRSKYKVRRYREVIYAEIEDAEVFFFPYAAIVCWWLNDANSRQIISEVKPFEYQPLTQICEDEFTFRYGYNLTIEDDDITLPDHGILTKLACSHAIAQSVKIDSFEQTIQKTIDITKELPERLAEEGRISLGGKEIRKMMGRLFIDRSSINLHQELLDTPEFFWEHPDLEPLYRNVAHYLDRERRVHVLNQRLTVLKELFDMLNEEVNHKHSSRLEWIIIWLILIEVIIVLSGDILKFL